MINHKIGDFWSNSKGFKIDKLGIEGEFFVDKKEGVKIIRIDSVT